VLNEQRCQRLLRESGVVLDAVEALLARRKDELAVGIGEDD
jgi:hypothetical protein